MSVPEEVQVHGMPLAGVGCISQAVPVMLCPDAGEVGFDNMVQHDGKHLCLKRAIFAE